MKQTVYIVEEEGEGVLGVFSTQALAEQALTECEYARQDGEWKKTIGTNFRPRVQLAYIMPFQVDGWWGQ